MLKKIPVVQLQLGMHLHGLCGPWLEHPFWRTKFVLADPEDLDKLRASAVTECWIDTDKGLDVGADAAAPPPAEPSAAPAAPAPRAAPTLPDPLAPSAPPEPVSLEDEAERAALVCAQARRQVAVLFGQARLGRPLDLASATPLVEDIAASLQRNAAALISLVRLKAHDDYTYMHSVAVCTLMVTLARRIGLDEAEVREAGLAGLLHDIGKAKMPLAVLNKPGRLTDAEYAVARRHARDGHELLRATGAAGAVTLDVCLHHHERPDGQGYPEGLSGDALSLYARMGAVCDVYDAITSNRPYNAAWEPAEALARMAGWAKAGQFDSDVFRAFVSCLGIYPIGSLVRLHSERLALVVEQNAASPAAPRVRAFYSIRSQLPTPVETLDLGRRDCRDRIIGRESNAQWRFPFLDELLLGKLAARPAHAG